MENYLNIIANNPSTHLLDDPSTTIAQDGDLRVAYAPFDHIAQKARIVIVGITPGRKQADNAIIAVRRAMLSGKSYEEALLEAKSTGSFSGPLRKNLIAMLDSIGTAGLLNVQSTASIFQPDSQAVHFTSALRYPVFVNGKNYNGTPDMLKTPILRQMIETHLAEEAKFLPDALWLPLGPKPTAALKHIANKGLLDPTRILEGLPHPSGANQERVSVFLGKKRPADVSNKTNPDKLLAAFKSLTAQVQMIKGAAV